MQRVGWFAFVVAFGIILNISRAKAEEPEGSPPTAKAAEREAQVLERRKLLRELAQTYQRFRELKAAGDEDATAEVKEKLTALRKRVAEFGPAGFMLFEGPDGQRLDARSPAVQQMRKRLAQLQEQLAKAQQADDSERVEELKKEIQQMTQKARLATGGNVAARSPVRRLGGPQKMEPSSVAQAKFLPQRIHHLRIAAANLDAAGMKDYAAKVRNESERLAQQLRQQHDAAAGSQVRKLSEQVRRLTEEVAELKKQLKALSERD